MTSETSDVISFGVSEHDTPRVFISYRWGAHDAWVSQLACDLTAQGVEVIHDRSLRRDYPSHNVDEFLNLLMQSMNGCHAFIPIFTPEYLERIGYRDGKPLEKIDDGFVFDEFQKSLLLGKARKIETIAVLLDGEFAHVPSPFTDRNSLDMRLAENYTANISSLARYLHFQRAIKQRKPRITRGLVRLGDA